MQEPDLSKIFNMSQLAPFMQDAMKQAKASKPRIEWYGEEFEDFKEVKTFFQKESGLVNVQGFFDGKKFYIIYAREK